MAHLKLHPMRPTLTNSLPLSLLFVLACGGGSLVSTDAATDGVVDSGLDVAEQDTAPQDTGLDSASEDAAQDASTDAPADVPDDVEGVGPANATGRLTPDARELYDLMMAYRATEGLPSIPVSIALSQVAQSHVWDSNTNMPAGGSCNLHSWSDTSPWTGCCYTSDHAQAECMWRKPREFTSYTGNGYEISASGTSDPERALQLWQGSSGHDDVIMNRGIWDAPWGAIGLAIEGGSAHVWFGREAE